MSKKVCSVASLSVFITIPILFLDPFSQQIVSLVDCEQVHKNKSGTILGTNYYELQQSFSRGATVKLPCDLRNSIKRGIYATNKPQVRFDRETGNCRY